MVDIDIVVVNYQKYHLTSKFIKSFVDNKPKTKNEVYLVDNESRPDELYKIDTSDIHVFPFKENLGYAKACNFGSSMSDSKYIGLFNNDIEFVNNQCIDMCVDFMEENPEVGIVGPFQYSTKGNKRRVTNAGIIGSHKKPQHRGWRDLDTGQYRFNEKVLMIMGSAMIIRREFWNKIMEDPIFKERFPKALGAMPETELYYEDTTLCYAAPKFGYEVWYLGEPGCELIHQWHQTIKEHPTSDRKFTKSREIFRELMDAWGIEHD